jgi:hypothetical protein
MRSREYWEIPDAGKRYLRRYFLFPFPIYVAIGSALYLARPDDLFILLILAGGGIWFICRVITDMRRMVSHPVCRLTDEFIASDYDRRLIPWNKVTQVIWRPAKHRALIFYRLRPNTRRVVFLSIHERPVVIHCEWMKNVTIFYEDLRTMCQERSIPFLEIEKGFGPHPRSSES